MVTGESFNDNDKGDNNDDDGKNSDDNDDGGNGDFVDHDNDKNDDDDGDDDNDNYDIVDDSRPLKLLPAFSDSLSYRRNDGRTDGQTLLQRYKEASENI